MAMRAPTRGVGPGLVAQARPMTGPDDVETGDEARLGGRGVEQSTCCREAAEKHGAGDEPGQQQAVITGRLGRLA